jgi:hypothetical protein
VVVLPRDDRAVVFWDYDPDLFERQTIEDLADEYRVLLAALVADPSASLHQIVFGKEVAVAGSTR